MKGFIEVNTEIGNDKILVNITNIKQVCNNYIHYENDYDRVKESYEEIKELIKQAQL